LLKDRLTKRWSTYEPFCIPLGDKRIADIVITNHALARWNDRISREENTIADVCDYLWDRLKRGSVRSYYRNEQDVYLVDDDLVMVAEFGKLDRTGLAGEPLHKMIVVTFLGKMSETMELRDLKTYYSWLRHSRRMTLIKNTRKRR
jgi:hypothetical protein